MGPECNDVRNTNNLGCRWQKIQQDVSKFHGFYERLERHPRSGTTPDDMQLTKMNEYNRHRSSNGNTLATHENVVNLGDESMTSTGFNSDEVVRPQGRKGCKEKMMRLNDENGVVDVLKKLQCTLEKQIEFNQKELELKREKDMKQFEMREQTLRKDLELKDTAQKLKIKDQELRERELKRGKSNTAL
ncbi:glutathione S-transferase T2-like [Forsythia ovata]|uniref:Glutathione S-transferase T2-like n=1 Tax=Forsythia ovata TaxID=205694 RepID=A0ABD1T604_9LAMI